MSRNTGGSDPPDDDQPETAQTTERSWTDSISRRRYLSVAGASALAATAAGTASAVTERYGISFDRVVHAVDDLGMDPTGGSSISGALQQAAADNTLVAFPDGEFRLGANVVIEDYRNFGVVGSGNTRLVVPGGQKVLIVYRNVDNGLFADLTLDQTAQQCSVATKFFSPSYNHVENIEVTGFNQPMDGEKIGFKIIPYATDSAAEIVVKNFSAAEGGRLGDYIGGGGGMYVGPGHRGTARIIDCHLEEWANNGIYAGRANGPVQVVGGVYRNCDVSQVRLSGPNSYVEGATIEVDMSKSDNPGTPLGQRGVLIETGQVRKTGGGIYDCDIRYNDSPSAGNAVMVHGNAGYAEINNTTIEVNRDDARAVRAIRPQATNGGDRPEAPEPHYVDMNNVTVTGSASGNQAVTVTDRPNSTVRNCCLHQTGSNRDGVRVVDSNGCAVEDSTIDVTGSATKFVRSQVATSGISTDGTCSTADGTDGTSGDDSTADSNSKSVVVQSDSSDDERVTYSLTVDGDLTAAASVDAHETMTSDGVEGIIRYGTDEYTLDGTLVDATADGPIAITVDGQQVDLSQFDDQTAELAITPTADDPSQEISYSFTADGAIASGGNLNDADQIDGSTATGTVFNGVDTYELSGSLTDFQTDGDLTVTLDGQQVDLSQFAEPDVKRLAISADSDEKISYEVAVGGTLTATDTVDAHEDVGDSSATGVLFRGLDEFEFTGSLTTLTADGPITATVDGEPVDLSQFAEPSLPHSLVIDGSATDTEATYSFSVDGTVEKAPDLGSVNDGDVIDSGSVTGTVFNGADGYRFDGDVVSFSVDGTATVTFEDDGS